MDKAAQCLVEASLHMVLLEVLSYAQQADIKLLDGALEGLLAEQRGQVPGGPRVGQAPVPRGQEVVVVPLQLHLIQSSAKVLEPIFCHQVLACIFLLRNGL
eukprot:CAMPEP_0206409012 /NCGR_PEP_ID=MMETSP0294-20121207/31558_1 /ASSEMBLY_ACC=CAM_ASM_000327 /TAXON_ID=39354 /ORGANISM="Heterosigma akashiwo, Strain CCMP2393" /LENGTH=100 /DNA_ID=CAMNT_0053868715 /DNA_START=71 /DNA_END=370 /DNA_ORIENTATION=-